MMSHQPSRGMLLKFFTLMHSKTYYTDILTHTLGKICLYNLLMIYLNPV